MNWGKWIVTSFVLFGVFIATLVTVCMKQDVSLVSKDYYTEELAYQQQIVRIQNTHALTEKPVIAVIHDSLQIRFTQLAKIEKGKLVLFCPANPGLDQNLTIEATASGKQYVELKGAQHGMYHAKFFWTLDGKDFYLDKTITL